MNRLPKKADYSSSPAVIILQCTKMHLIELDISFCVLVLFQLSVRDPKVCIGRPHQTVFLVVHVQRDSVFFRSA